MQQYTLSLTTLLCALFLVPVNASLNSEPNSKPEVELARELCEIAQNGKFEQALCILNNHQLVNSTTQNNNSKILLAAVRYGDETLVQLLLYYSADINWQDANHNTALHVAISHRNIQVAQLLLDRGADVTIQDKNGNTALHFAVASNDIELVKLLIIYQAHPDAPNYNGATPVHWACNKNYKNLAITQLLVLYRATLPENQLFTLPQAVENIKL